MGTTNYSPGRNFLQKFRNMRFTHFIVLALVCFLIFKSEKAKSQTDTVDVFSLSIEELMNVKVDLGTKIEGLSVKDIPAQITIISRSEIQLSGARSLPELITLVVPGAMGIFDADDYIFAFRGFAPDNNSMVKLLVNGQDVGFSANQNSSSMMALLDLNYIERLEVITGPGSSIFGSGPLFGVINIVTHADKENSVKVGTRFGSGKYKDTYGNVQLKLDNGFMLSSNFALFSQVDGYEIKDTTGDRKEWPIFDRVYKDGKYHESKPGYSFFTTLKKGNSNLSVYSTKFVWDNLVSGMSTQMKDMRTAGGKFETKFNLSDKITIQPSVFLKNIYFQAQVADSGRHQSADYGDELNYGGEVKISYTSDKLQAVLGGIFNRHEYGYNTFGGSNMVYIAPGTKVYDQAGNEVLVSQYKSAYWQMADKRKLNDIDVIGELRYKLTDQFSFHASALLSYDGATEETNFGPRASLIFNTGKFWTKAIYTHAFRTPIPMAVGDLPAGGFFRHFINKNLETQKVEDLELHIGYGNENVMAQVVAFYNMNKGIIMGGSADLVPGFDGSKWAWTFANGGDINTMGMEITADWKISGVLALKASHSIIKVKSVDYENKIKQELYTDFKGEHLFNYPENVSKISLTYSPLADLKIRTDFLADYGRYRTNVRSAASIDDPNMVLWGREVKSDNWYNWNLGVQYTIAKKFEITANIFNILDSTPYQSIIARSEACTPYPRTYTIGFAFIVE